MKKVKLSTCALFSFIIFLYLILQSFAFSLHLALFCFDEGVLLLKYMFLVARSSGYGSLQL